MKFKIKRILSVLLVLCMMMGMLPNMLMTAHAADPDYSLFRMFVNGTKYEGTSLTSNINATGFSYYGGGVPTLELNNYNGGTVHFILIDNPSSSNVIVHVIGTCTIDGDLSLDGGSSNDKANIDVVLDPGAKLIVNDGGIGSSGTLRFYQSSVGTPAPSFVEVTNGSISATQNTLTIMDDVHVNVETGKTAVNASKIIVEDTASITAATSNTNNNSEAMFGFNTVNNAAYVLKPYDSVNPHDDPEEYERAVGDKDDLYTGPYGPLAIVGQTPAMDSGVTTKWLSYTVGDEETFKFNNKALHSDFAKGGYSVEKTMNLSGLMAGLMSEKTVTVNNDSEAQISHTFEKEGNYRLTETLKLKKNGETVATITHIFNIAVNKAPDYTLSFDANGGSGSMTALTGSTSYVLPECTFTAPEGKVFAGWNVFGYTQAAGTTVNLSQNDVATAVWKDAPVVTGYTLSFEANGGSGEMTALTGETSYVLPECTFTAPEGKVFAGWSVYGVVTPVGETVYLGRDVVAYATWKDAGYTLSFDADGGTGEMTALTGETSYVLPECTFTAPEGKVFAGWSVYGVVTPVGETVYLGRDVVAYATWKDAPVVTGYTLSFDANGGSGEMTALTGETSQVLPECTFTAPEGKVFAGWSVYGVITPVGETVYLVRDVVAYATWKDAPVECDHANKELDKDATGHWYVCPDCEELAKDVKDHEYDDDADATCNVCGYEREVGGDVPPVNPSVELNKDKLALVVPGSEKLTATVTPDGLEGYKLVWSSSDASVATVDQNGNVTAVAAGTATITVELQVGTARTQLKDTCEVTVTLPADDDNGDDTDKPSDDNKDDESKPSDTNKPATDTESPKTGDTSNIFMWFAVLFVSGFALVGFTLFGRKRRA